MSLAPAMILVDEHTVLASGMRGRVRPARYNAVTVEPSVRRTRRSPFVSLSLGSKAVITLDIAKAVGRAAEVHIAAHDFAMFVAVVDDAGTPLYVVRTNDAQPASYDVALQKAQVSARFRRPTKGFEDRILADGRVNLLSLPGIVAVEGGLPLVVDGTVVGAIGVSGGTGVQDGEVAAAAVAALPGLLGRT